MQTKIHTQYKRNKEKTMDPASLFFSFHFGFLEEKKQNKGSILTFFPLYCFHFFLIKNNQLNHNLIIENKQNQTKQNKTKQQTKPNQK